MANKPTSQFTAIATLDSADRIVAYEASASELRTVTGTVILTWIGASLDMSTIASGGALPVARGGTGITSFGTGIATFLGTPSSANLLAAITDETGTGALVFANSPTLVTPALGTPASGVLTNCTGTASGLTAGNVTTNANLTGPITSVGNATSIASQTGTGTKFVVDTSPVLITPTLGVATATSLACPTFTSSAAIGFTPAAGSGFNITLSTTGDFVVNTNQLYVDTSAGNVGIGTASPAVNLDVVSTTSYAIGRVYSTVDSQPAIWRSTNDAGINLDMKIEGSVASGTLFGVNKAGLGNIITGNAPLVIGTGGAQDLVLGTNLTGNVTIQNGGNVGIGITSPTALCHLGASTTSRASLCIPSGTAPTSPVNGDIWSDGSDLKVRLGGVTYTLTKT